MAIASLGKPLEMITIEDPVPERGEVVLSVKGCGVCYTDLKVIHGRLPIMQQAVMPLVPGHEIVGVVEAVGPGVEEWQVGGRAVVHHFVGCGYCVQCQAGRDTLCSNLCHLIGFDINGGYAEKVKVPARNLVRVSSTLPDEKAAIIPCSVATAFRAVVVRARVKAGDRVLVIGAGGVGIHTAQIALLSGGYTIVVDVDQVKLDIARELGVDETYNVSSPSDLPASLRVNKVIETSGAMRDWGWLVRVLEGGGTLVLVGYAKGRPFTLETPEFIVGEFTIKASRASTYEDLTSTVDLVERGKIQPVVGSVFPLEEANEVLAKLDAGKLSARAVLVPGASGKGPRNVGC